MKIADTLKKRVDEDTLKIGDRTFKIRNFDPLSGNYIMMQLLTMVLPFGIGDMLSAKVGMPKAEGKLMAKEDFLALQRDILSYAAEELPGRNAPIINDNGSYGIENFTMSLALQLLIAVVAFNFSDFFGDDPLTNILGSDQT